MDIKLVRDLELRVASIFRPSVIYFPPYDAKEIREILWGRMRVGLYSGVLSAEMLDLIVEQTMESGDVRVGIDMMKRAVMSAEAADRKAVCREDVCAAYEHSRYVHLTCTVRTLNAAERRLLRHIAEMSRGDKGLVSGEIYAAVKNDMKIGYTAFFERFKKLDELRLIDLQHRNEWGRTRDIVLRYDPGKVREVCG